MKCTHTLFCGRVKSCCHVHTHSFTRVMISSPHGLLLWSNCGTGDTDVSQSTLSGVFPQAIDSQGRSICSNTAAWSANMDGKEMTLLCFMANGSAM